MEKIKERIIEELKCGVDFVPYIEGQENLSDDDWQDIANEIGNTLYYDDCIGTYTMEGFVSYFKTVEPQ